jgi:Mrp family chromosome partitioning ATPase
MSDEARVAVRTPAQTSFEHELAIKMANSRYLNQCQTMAHRIRQDLANGPGRGVVVLLSCDDDCDVSDVAVALGHVVAQPHTARVLLVDAHVGVQALSHHYHVAGLPGLAEVYKSMDRWNALVQPTHRENLFLMPAGCRLDPDPPSQDILGELMRTMRDPFDLVIVDAGKADSPWAGPCLTAGDAAYLVVQLGKTDRAQAIRMMASLKARQLSLKGCIVTNSAASSKSHS